MRYRCSTARRYSNRATPGILTEQHPVAFCFEERGAFFVSRYPCRHFTVSVLRPPPLTPPHKGEGNTPIARRVVSESIGKCVALTVRPRLLYSRGPGPLVRACMSKLSSMVSGVAMAALAALVVPTAAQAQTESQAQSWPQRPVRFIVGLGPGSAQDIAARLFGDQLSKRWGQPVVIENKPGADGIVAINAFTGAHDPHTLLFAASGTFTAHPTQYAKLPYDPSDLVPLARVSSTIIAVSVPTAGTTEITFDNFLKTSGVTMTKIPYSDVTEALADLAENRVQVMVAGIALVKSQVETGKVKILAITNLKRAAAVPELPTGTEAGYPALALDGLIGLFGPKNLPPGTAERIAADVQAVAADPAIGPRLAATGQQLDPGGTAEFAAAVDAQRKSIAATAKALGIQPTR